MEVKNVQCSVNICVKVLIRTVTLFFFFLLIVCCSEHSCFDGQAVRIESVYHPNLLSRFCSN